MHVPRILHGPVTERFLQRRAVRLSAVFVTVSEMLVFECVTGLSVGDRSAVTWEMGHDAPAVHLLALVRLYVHYAL